MVDSKMVSEALSHLGAALAQSIASDDQVVVGHIRSAFQILGGNSKRYSGYPWTTLEKPKEQEGFVVRRASGKVVVFPWTKISLHVQLLGGDVVNRYELWPLGPEHLGITGISEFDVGRRLVVDYSVSNKNWTKVEHIQDLP